jgi:hypothetical protein
VRRKESWLFAVLALVGVSVAAIAPTSPELVIGVLYAAPFALLMLSLLSGRYVGERHLAGWRRCRSRRGVRAPAHAGCVTSRPEPAKCPRGGLLIAASLAKRPPPGGFAFCA